MRRRIEEDPPARLAIMRTPSRGKAAEGHGLSRDDVLENNEALRVANANINLHQGNNSRRTGSG